jgi:hypothetical protein
MGRPIPAAPIAAALSLLAHRRTLDRDRAPQYVGVEGIVETQLWERIVLLLSPSDRRPARLAGLRTADIASYTAVQLLLLALCWAINLSPAGLCVAFVIVALVPFRERVLPRLYTERTLAALDSERHDKGAITPKGRERVGLVAAAPPPSSDLGTDDEFA